MDEEGSHDLLESNTDVVLVEKPRVGEWWLWMWHSILKTGSSPGRGRPQQFASEWGLVTSDRLVLLVISKGYYLEFTAPPTFRGIKAM